MRSLESYTEEIKELKHIIRTTQTKDIIKRQYERRLHELIGRFTIEHQVFFTKNKESNRYSKLNEVLAE